MTSEVKDVLRKENKMSDGIVILGTVLIVGMVAIVAIALVYDRPLWIRGSKETIEIKATSSASENELTRTDDPANKP